MENQEVWGVGVEEEGAGLTKHDRGGLFVFLFLKVWEGWVSEGGGRGVGGKMGGCRERIARPYE